MKILDKMGWKVFVVVVIGVALSAILGYREYSRKELMKQELNLDGLFINIKGVNVKTVSSNLFSEKPYKSIVIKIPSIASEGDDATKEGGDKTNQIIDREKLNKGFESWLKNIFNSDFAKTYTDDIEVWYRDHKIIDLPNDEGSWK